MKYADDEPLLSLLDPTSAADPCVLERIPRSGRRVELKLDRISRKGRAEAHIYVVVGPDRLPRHLVIEVRGAVPGDQVIARVQRARRRRVEAVLVEIVVPSPDRVVAPCPHVGLREEAGKGCGGCTLQELGYDAQLREKRTLVQTLMAASGHDPDKVAAPLPCATHFRYRNKMDPGFGDDGAGRFSLGLRPAGFRHDILRLQSCHLQSEPGDRLMVAVREWAEAADMKPWKLHRDGGFLESFLLREGRRTGERLVALTTSGEETARFNGIERPSAEVAQEFADAVVAMGERLDAPVTSVWWIIHRTVKGAPTVWETHHLAGRETLKEVLKLEGQPPLSFEIHPRAFFQPNSLQAEVLYAAVAKAAGLGPLAEDADGVKSGGGRAKRILDLYCGTGTIALCMASYADEIIGIEREPSAVVDARANAAANGITNARFIEGDVGETLVAEGLDQPGAADLVIVDPPRAGLLTQAVEALTRIAAPRLVYVSCNPASLAKDGAALVEAGWRLLSAQPVDMFPHTVHIETVALFERAGESAQSADA